MSELSIKPDTWPEYPEMLWLEVPFTGAKTKTGETCEMAVGWHSVYKGTKFGEIRYITGKPDDKLKAELKRDMIHDITIYFPEL